MWNPFRRRVTYTKGQPVWCVSVEHGAMPGRIVEALRDGYIINIQTLTGPTKDYWVRKQDTHERLRPRTEA